jgi:hypothetical protein
VEVEGTGNGREERKSKGKLQISKCKMADRRGAPEFAVAAKHQEL